MGTPTWFNTLWIVANCWPILGQFFDYSSNCSQLLPHSWPISKTDNFYFTVCLVFHTFCHIISFSISPQLLAIYPQLLPNSSHILPNSTCRNFWKRLLEIVLNCCQLLPNSRPFLPHFGPILDQFFTYSSHILPRIRLVRFFTFPFKTKPNQCVES